MRKTHVFKGGFEVGEKDNFFAYQLTVVTDRIDDSLAYRLSEAVDNEYKEILEENIVDREVFGQWQDNPLN